MNFADIRKKFSGGDRSASADPSRAFGSEAEMMQALRKQEFTPPKPRPTAAEVMGSIRQRFARPAEEMQDRIPRDEAAARTYAPEAMAQPEWENPFTAPEKPKKPARDVPVYETVGGDMPFERRSAPAYIPQSYAPQQGYDPYGGYAAPYPPAGYDPYAAVPYPPQGYAAPAYGAPYYDPYAAPAYDPRYNAPYPPNAYYAPQPPYPPSPPQGSAPAPEATTLHRYSANKQQKQGRTGLGASLCFQLLIPPPAWACRGACTWSSSRRGGCSHSRCSGTGGRRAACAARHRCIPSRFREARRPS